jgi:hypothetical protein
MTKQLKIWGRVEIPVYYDLWMRGARFGTLVDSDSEYYHVKMDHPQVKKILKIPRRDWEAVKII